ncbi:hypothetical protein Taro_055819, partial [Colocasia esculenta]|nr:hypothetical protein [Colocasia esculenta]
LTRAWFNREAVDKFDEEVQLFLARNKDNVTSEVDLPDMKEEEMEEEEKPVKTASSRKRGYTTCHHVYAMEEGRRIYVAWNDIGQPVGPGGRSLRSFLGTIARDLNKMPINFQDWRKLAKTCKDDVFAYVQRSSETNRKNKGKQKWFHCAGTRSVADIHEERVKGHLDLDRSDLFIKRHTRKDGKPTNEAAKHVIEKLKSLKSAQPLSDDSTPHQVAARNDTYTQVLGPDRPSRVSGVSTGPTPTSMWGNESKEALRSENRLLMQRMEELVTSMAEKFAKMESMITGSQGLVASRFAFSLQFWCIGRGWHVVVASLVTGACVSDSNRSTFRSGGSSGVFGFQVAGSKRVPREEDARSVDLPAVWRFLRSTGSSSW